jgi:hypothetical protein
MERPDPATDFIGSVRYLISLEESNAERLSALENSIGVKNYLTTKELAARWRCSPFSLSREPWKLPNFGRADKGRSPKMWAMATVEAWEAVPDEEHRREWELMSADAKREVLGVSA